MTDSEINIAVAEACGWTRSEKGWWSHPTLPDNGGSEPEPPDYVNDLNACHEMEKALDRKRNGQIVQYAGNLWRVMYMSPEAEIGTIHAIARQRAEAFLRTVGKWKEG